MSDLLHDAVQAEIDAYSPHSAPPFDALVARQRTSARRGRLAAGGVAALSAVAVVAAALTVPSLGTGGDWVVTSASPAQAGGPVREYWITNRADVGFVQAVRETDRGIRGCLELPGVVTREAYPAGYVASAGGDVSERLEACLRDVPDADYADAPQSGLGPVGSEHPRVASVEASLARLHACMERGGATVERLPGGGTGVGLSRDIADDNGEVLKALEARCQADLGVATEPPTGQPR